MKNLNHLIFLPNLIKALIIGAAAVFLWMSFNKKPDHYVQIQELGCNGYGAIDVSIQYETLLEEKIPRSKIVEEGGFSSEDISQMLVEYSPYTPVITSDTNLHNGDTVSVIWEANEEHISVWQNRFGIKINTPSDFTYTVSHLKEAVEIDPFEGLVIGAGECEGESGSGSVSQTFTKNISYQDKIIPIVFTLNSTENGNWKNGDQVSLRIEAPDDPAYYEKVYGVTLKQMEGTATIQGLAYFPYENPELILTSLDKESLDNAQNAISFWLNIEGEKRVFTLAYTALYYQNEGNVLEDTHNTNNQLVLIYHVENGIIPGGWYVYLAPNNDVMLKNNGNDGTPKTVLNTQSALSGNYLYYTKGQATRSKGTCFTYNERTYPGSLTIAGCLMDYEETHLKDKSFDNKIGQARDIPAL